MKIAVIGTGYVGLVTGVCFAEMGNVVTCVEIDEAKVAKLKQAVSPIFEPGLEELLKRNIRDRRISFTSSLKDAMPSAELVFIAVGTPPGEDGSADLKYVLGAARQIAAHMNDYKLVVTKSTVPVGTNDKVKSEIKAELKRLGKTGEFDVASNPEFLKEGAAINDFMKPDRIVIGTDSERAQFMLEKLYDSFVKNGHMILAMDIRSAEMTKYASNAMLATKISFMNEIARLCEDLGVDVENVRKGMGSDPRIGRQFIYPGLGYGGSCFPKDVQALVQMGKEMNRPMAVLKAVDQVNREQATFFVDKIRKKYGDDLSKLHFGVWGLTFKPDTDDLREAPALTVVSELLRRGASVTAHDPVANHEAAERLPKSVKLKFADEQYDALNGADALCLMTEWKPFREPDLDRMRNVMKARVVFDGRNIYHPKFMEGFEYHGIGRTFETVRVK